MTEEYFEEIVHLLNPDELRILEVLHENEAHDTVKSLKSSFIMKHLEMSRGVYYNSLSKLIATNLIKSFNHSKNYSIFITPYGCAALDIKTEGRMSL